MTPTRWQHIQDLVNATIDLPPAGRAAFLSDVCGSNAEMRQQIDNLLESYEQAGSFIERAVEAGAYEVFTNTSPAEGERIGAYQITGTIGHGGMGTVYCARRVDEQYRQDVAIKVIRGGIGQTPELLTRFRAERQILASLTHPNIARLLDGGITTSGLPYLVMEYIEGTTIESFAGNVALSIPLRLELFRQVCAAVQHAHQNLIVHRDIKPANVMVTQDGTPKLLDFGIAKLLRPDAMEQTLALTRPAERLMTPEYASPEQIRGEKITTAVDVYALGVLLYELLSGRRPFRAERPNSATLERLICESNPERPSTARRASNTVSSEKIASDLDNIVLKAMHKDPARRYASAAELSEDVRRYLQGFPVIARSDSWWYRTRKFVARNKIANAVAALFVLTTTVLSISLAIQVTRAQREAQTADKVSNFLVSLVETLRPDQTQGRGNSAKDILDRGAERIPAELAGQPLVEARLFNILGTTYRELGVLDRAASTLTQAHEISSRMHGPDSREAAESLLTLAEIASDKGEFENAEKLFQQVLRTYTRLDGPRSEKTIRAMNGIGEVRRMLGDLHGAEKLYREVIVICAETKGPGDWQTLSAKNDLAAVLANEGDYSGAEAVARENVAAEIDVLGANHPSVALTLNLLAYVLGRTARFAEAERALKQALDILQRVDGPEHPAISLNLSDMSGLARELGHYKEADKLGNEALSMSLKLTGGRSLGTAAVQGQLGLTMLAEKKFDQASELLQAALATRLALGNPDNPELGDNYDRVGLLNLAVNDLSAAHLNIQRGLEIREKFYGGKDENVAKSLIHMARVFAAEGNYKAAEQRYRRATEIANVKFPGGHTITADALLGLGTTLMSQGRIRDAELSLTQSLEIRRKLLPPEHPDVAESASVLAKCLKATRQPVQR